jgi:hypothetical protein
VRTAALILISGSQGLGAARVRRASKVQPARHFTIQMVAWIQISLNQAAFEGSFCGFQSAVIRRGRIYRR